MAGRFAEVQARLHNLHELQEVVGAMRAMAAARVQEAQAALDGTRAYAQDIGDAIAEALPLLPADGPAADTRAPSGMVLFMAEHGFIGGFNDELADAAPRTERGVALFVVGSRGHALIEERGLAPAWATEMATHAGAVIDTARRVAGTLYRRFEEGGLGAAEIVYFSSQRSGRRQLERQSLLPIDLGRFPPPRSAVPPLSNLPPPALIGGLIEEYVFAQLAHAAMESFAAENAARLAAMQAARDKLDERLFDLQSLERRLRQEEITGELLELVTGLEAAR